MKKSNIVVDVVVGYLNNGFSVKNVATLCGCSVQHIYYLMRTQIKGVTKWVKIEKKV